MFADRANQPSVLAKLGKSRPVRLRAGEGSRLMRLRSPAVGVKVCDNALCLASVRPGLGRGWVVSTGRMEDYAQLTSDQFAEKLRNFLEPLRGEEPILVLGLPRRQSVVRISILPKVARKAQREALALQAEMYKPADEGSFCWDALVKPSNGNSSVSLAFATREQIDRLAAMFTAAGYPLARITLSQFALAQLVLRNHPDSDLERLVIVDVSETDAEIAILEKGQLVYTRGFARQPGTAIQQILTSEIQQAFATLRWKEETAAEVLFTAPADLDLAPALAQFGKARSLKTWLELDGTNSADRGDTLGAVALALQGLAWRDADRVNLLPVEMRPSRRRWRYAPTYALIAVNVLLLLAFAAREPLQRSILVRQYKREIATVQKVSNQTQQALDQQKQAYQRIELIRDFQVQGHESLDALVEITQRLPADTWLNHFAYRQGQVDLSGVSKSAAALLPLLQASPQFTNIKFNGGLTRDPSGVDRFRLQLQVKPRP